MNVQLILTPDKIPSQLEKGEGIVFKKADGKGFGLIFACPGCGQQTATTTHIFDKYTLSILPSLIHYCDIFHNDMNSNGCGWHGWLKNGEFIKC